MPKILNYSEFCENLDEVKSLKLIAKKKYHPDGLFSEQIFGPIKNYTCQCGTYYGPSHKKTGGKCDICKVDIVNSDVRRKRFAKITIPIRVVNPLFYDLLVEVGGKTLKAAIDDLMRNEKSYMYSDGVEHIVSTNESQRPTGRDVEVFERSEAIYKLVYEIAKMFAGNGVEAWQIVLDNIDNLLINQIIVLPPDLRPASKGGGGKHLMDKINRYYTQILTKKELMQGTTLNIRRDKKLYYDYFRRLQKDVNELYNRILEKMAKKEGLIRGNILGKRIDFSGRAVITPDPSLTLDECKLPYFMILEMFKLQVAKRIIEMGKFKLLNKAIDFVDRCIVLKNPDLFNVAKEIVEGKMCILNRQPSLHKLGMLGFKIRITSDQVIKIHPLVCPPFNADFDGDQMAVYIPVTEGAKEEIIEKIAVANNLNSPSNENLTTTPSQDIILGIYFLTTGVYDGQLDGDNGIDIFNKTLPDDYPRVEEEVNEKKLLDILNDVKDKYPSDVVIETLDNIKKIGFTYATLFGCTMSLENFHSESLNKLRDTIYSKGTTRQQLVSSSNKGITKALRENFDYAYMIESGARGSWDQVKQIIMTRGFVSNFDGLILPEPIKHNLVEGLTQKEFFYSTYGCRKGLLDIALNTGTSGYLSRKLIFTCANLQIDLNLEDCGTTDLLEVYVKTERKARMLVNRYQSKEGTLELITKQNYKDIIGKVILIRSPILCKSPKLCKTCYGDLHKKLNSRFVGIIAAQTLGERGTQLVLRTFHTSGSATIQGEDTETDSMKQKDIIGDLASVSQLLHKFRDKTYTDIVEELFEVYDKDIYHVHFECVVAQLMWKNYKKWRLLRDRHLFVPDYYSIQSVPNQESWILAMAFSNPKRSILQGILNEGRYSGIMDKILKGESIQ
jgi:DNA-directed RNA polymerase subunit beta'